MQHFLLSFALFLALLLAACSSREEGPGGIDRVDGGPDSGSSTMTDAGGGGRDTGAGPVDAGPEPDAGPLTGDSYFYVLSFMDLAAPAEGGDPMVVDGFDIDNRVSDASDVSSCRKEDYTSPPPASTPGIDNQLGPLLASAEDTFHIRANLEANVQSGAILVLLEVRGVDDLVNDDRVEVDAYVGVLPVGVTAPMLDAGGRITGGQTFDVDAMSAAADMTALITLAGAIEAGRLSAGPGDFTMSLPLEDTRVTFEAKSAHIAFDIDATTLSEGVVGGALDVDETVMAMEGVMGFDAATARLLLETNADLDRDDAAMECRSISIALAFEGVDATRGATRAP